MPASLHDEGQVAGSATHGPRTDLELWLKGHFCWQDAKGHRDQRWNFIAYMMLFFFTAVFLLLFSSRETSTLNTKRKQITLYYCFEKQSWLLSYHFGEYRPLANSQPEFFLKKEKNPLFSLPFCKKLITCLSTLSFSKHNGECVGRKNKSENIWGMLVIACFFWDDNYLIGKLILANVKPDTWIHNHL